MNKKKIFIIGILTLGIALGIAGIYGTQSRAADVNDWSGSWQMGPSLDTSVLGCTAGDGLARFSGTYYPDQDRVYFLGGRCEADTTTGSVFYFNPVTETFVDTGMDMPVPVSNYQIAVINNDGRGHGTGFYIFGGRTGDGGQTDAVQVYYPDDNLAEQILTDPIPDPVLELHSPGGVVALNDKAYVFGGFDGAVMYAETRIYDPLAAAGTRWSDTGCDLPTPRSYIASVAVGTKIYAIGGDEIPTLTPINDTVVFDTATPAACWQDGLMADLPQADGDAPAVYVDERIVGGGIFVVGGLWPAPGPDRWVFRYDIAGDLWETFPSLAIPAPATGRRNQAAVYIPASSGGTGDGIPGIWTFGGYDGSGTNAMTDTSEFFANTWLLPNQNEVTGNPGDSVNGSFTIYNILGSTETFDLSGTALPAWTFDLPATIGPIAAGASDTITMTVNIPSTAVCGDSSLLTVTATAQSDPGVTKDASFTARVICGVSGTVTDTDTGLPIENAYVSFGNSVDGLGSYYDAYTDAAGHYLVPDVVPDAYYFSVTALHHQPSFYPDGWPAGAIQFTLSTDSVVQDSVLVASDITVFPFTVSVDAAPGSTTNQTLTLTNDGSGPYTYSISVLDNAAVQPPAGTLAVPGLDRVDKQILSDIEVSPEGTTDFVVVLNSQANVDTAATITDWDARGQAVYDLLTSQAEATQGSIRSFLDSQGVSYTPLYIINALIVRSGNSALVDALAARPDVNQLVANHKIAVEERVDNSASLLQTVVNPEAIEWNITKVKAPDVWALGYEGQGVVVAEIDTGTQFDHPALVNQYRGNNGDGTFTHDYNWYDPYFQCPNGGKTPCDPGQHGSHVMGTILGDDGGANQIGVAPGAKWISCKGGDAVSGYLLTNELLVCAEWILAPWDLDGNNPDPTMRPQAVNNSWGGGQGDYWFTGVVASWRAAGIFPAFSAGNEGPNCATTGSPGDNWHSFATGASDNTNAIAAFSSRGPALNTNVLKPQVTAPGVNIRSSVPGSAYQGGWSGTSMASPHSVGAVALLLSAAPELKGQVDLTAWVLEQSATPLLTTQGCGGDTPTTHPNNTFGYGLLNTLAAVNLALAGNLTPEWLSVSPQGGTVAPNSSSVVTLTITAPDTLGTYDATLWLVGDDPYNWDIRIPVTLNVGVNQFFLPFITK